MEQYSVLAKYYDALMRDVDYKKWADFYVSCFEKYGAKVKKIVDIGCGTGTITVDLAGRGYSVTGVDISSEMLALAQKKADDTKVFVRFAEQDMANLETGDAADAVVCALDGVNYLADTSALASCFYRVSDSLADGGLFIFDMNTPYKMKNILGDNAFVYEDDGMFLSWQCFFNERRRVCDYYLTFFSEDGGVWRRYDETQRQRAYSERTVKKLLGDAGFDILGEYSDIDFNAPTPTCDRLFFVCRKVK